MQLSADVVATLAVVATAVATVAVAGLVVVAVRLRRLRRTYRLATGDGPDDLVAAVAALRGDVHRVRADLVGSDEALEALDSLVRSQIGRVGFVRYDAFGDQGGALSFSAAFVDHHGNGLVLTAINGRSEARCYAKVIGSPSDRDRLSPEEREAVTAASGATGTPVGRHDRRAS